MDFFDDDDRRIELGNQLIMLLRNRLGFTEARMVAEKPELMTDEEKAIYQEWKPLEDEHLAAQEEAKSRNTVGEVYPSEWDLRGSKTGE